MTRTLPFGKPYKVKRQWDVVTQLAHHPVRERKYNLALGEMIKALTCVAKINEQVNAGSYRRLAREILDAGGTPEEIYKYYGADGWYYQKDWRGKRGQPPDRASIRGTYRQWSTSESTDVPIISIAKSDLCALTYQEFLNSDYWRYVRTIKLNQAQNKCELCNSDEALNVHHKTYEHHGEEHKHLSDLIVLCHKCHSKFHDKLAN
jgi:5-methylcytosine-specific restriction endonuclease McrA